MSRAGGLNKINVKQAIKAVKLFGSDLCTSVQTNGKPDKN